MSALEQYTERLIFSTANGNGRTIHTVGGKHILELYLAEFMRKFRVFMLLAGRARDWGLWTVTGPSGSGKTCAQYAALASWLRQTRDASDGYPVVREVNLQGECAALQVSDKLQAINGDVLHQMKLSNQRLHLHFVDLQHNSCPPKGWTDAVIHGLKTIVDLQKQFERFTCSVELRDSERNNVFGSCPLLHKVSNPTHSRYYDEAGCYHLLTVLANYDTRIGSLTETDMYHIASGAVKLAEHLKTLKFDCSIFDAIPQANPGILIWLINRIFERDANVSHAAYHLKERCVAIVTEINGKITSLNHSKHDSN